VANINGSYRVSGQNHNRAIYQMYEGELKDLNDKEKPVIYYWDERDGAAAQGWWIGIGVGGAQVWARHPQASQTPPETGWHIPYNGGVDQAARVSPKGGAGVQAASPPTGAAAGVKRPAPGDANEDAAKKPAGETWQSKMQNEERERARAKVMEILEECSVEVSSCKAAVESAVEVVKDVDWEQVGEDKAKEYETQYVASMNAASTLLKMAQKFLAEKLQECARNATQEQRQELSKKLGELQKLEAQMETTKKTAASGVVKARVWAEIAQVKLKVTQASENSQSVTESLQNACTGEASAEKIAELDALQTQAGQCFSTISEVKVAIAKHMQGASPEARAELVKQLSVSTTAEGKLRQAKQAATSFAQAGKEKVVQAEAEAKVAELEELVKKVGGEPVEDLSVEDAKEHLNTVTEKVNAAQKEVATVKEALTKQTAEARGPLKASLGVLVLKVGGFSDELAKQKLAAAKVVGSAEQHAATADVRDLVQTASKALNKAAEVADNLDDVGASAVQKSLDAARTAVTAASKAVYERLESVTGKNASTSPLNQSIKRALAEYLVTINQSETKLRQAQAKVDTNIENARVEQVMADLKKSVAAGEKKAEQVAEKVATKEPRPVEEAEKVATEVAALAQEALKFFEDAKTAIAEKMKEEDSSKAGGKLRPELAKLKALIIQKEVAVQRGADAAKQAHTAAVLDGRLKAAQEVVEALKGEVKQALEDIQSLLGAGIDGLAEERVLQVGGLVDDAAGQAKETAEKARTLLAEFKQLPPLHKARAQVQELETAVAEATKSLTSEMEPIKRACDLAGARHFLAENGSTVDKHEADVLTLVEKSAPLQGDTPAAEAVDSVRAAAEQLTSALETLRTTIQGKVNSLKPAPQTAELRQGLGKLRNRIVAAEGKSKKCLQLAISAPFRIQLLKISAASIAKVEEVEGKVATLDEARTALEAEAKDLALDACKAKAESLSSLATEAEKALDAAKTSLTELPDVGPDNQATLQAEVKKWSSRLTICETKLTAAKKLATSTVAKAEAREQNAAATTEVDRLTEALGGVEKAVEELQNLEDESKVRTMATGIEETVATATAQVDAQREKLKASACDAITKRDLGARLTQLKGKLEKADETARNLAENASLIILHRATKVLVQAHRALPEDSGGIFKQLDADGDGKVTPADLKALWPKHEFNVTDEQAARIFEYLDSGDQGFLADVNIAPLTQSNYKCVKKTAISDLFGIEKSKILRTLEVNEILECLQEAEEDQETKVWRCKVRSVRDKKVGWATIKGNSGTVFLEKMESDGNFTKQLDKKLKDRQKKAKMFKEAMADGETKVAAAEQAATDATERFAAAKAAAGDAAAKKEAATAGRRSALDVLKAPVKDARAWQQQQITSGTASKEQMEGVKKRIAVAEEKMQDLMSAAKELSDLAAKEAA
jgi:hypothetical protein